MMNLYKAGEVDANLQPHRAGSVDRCRCASSRTTWTRRRRPSSTYVFNTKKGAHQRRARAPRAEHGHRQGGARALQAGRQTDDLGGSARAFSRTTVAEGRSVRSGAGEGAAGRCRLPGRGRPVRPVDVPRRPTWRSSTTRPRATARLPSSSRRSGSRTSASPFPLRNVEFRTFLQMRSALDYHGLARSGWIGDYMDPFTFLSMYIAEGGRQRQRLVRPGIRALLSDANRQARPGTSLPDAGAMPRRSCNASSRCCLSTAARPTS